MHSPLSKNFLCRIFVLIISDTSSELTLAKYSFLQTHRQMAAVGRIRYIQLFCY